MHFPEDVMVLFSLRLEDIHYMFVPHFINLFVDIDRCQDQFHFSAGVDTVNKYEYICVSMVC